MPKQKKKNQKQKHKQMDVIFCCKAAQTTLSIKLKNEQNFVHSLYDQVKYTFHSNEKE